MRRWVGARLAGLLALALVGASEGPPRVELFSPTGSVEGVEQARIRFSQPMIALGDPRAPAPASAQCGAGAGRWVDTREWAYDFAAPLPGGLRCRFTLRPGLRTLGGVVVSGPTTFTFDTGGPTIVQSVPSADSSTLEEDQAFVLALNAPATAASVAEHARCVVEGVGEAIPFDPLPDADRERIVKGAGDDYPLRGLLERAGLKKPRYDDGEGGPKRPLALFAGRCRRALPPGGRVSLVWGAGISSPSGLATRSPTRLDMKVRAAFTARFECSRVSPEAGCSPIEPMRVRFIGQVPADAAARVTLTGPDGRSYAAKPVKPGTRLVDTVEFAGPFPERAAFRVAIPAALADDAGRPLLNAARFPLGVRTDEAPPLVKFAGTFGIVEADEGGVLPVTMRNVEPVVVGRTAVIAGRALRVDGADGDIAEWLRRLEKAEERTHDYEDIVVKFDPDGTPHRDSVETTRQSPLIAVSAPAKGLSVPKPNGTRPLEVVGIPLRAPGFYVVELASPRLGAALLGQHKTRYVAAGALVTDLSVHFAWGHGPSLVWVTRLHDGQPVAGAAVTVSDSCSGARMWQGRSDASGRAVVVSPNIPEPESYGSCDARSGNHPLMVSARTGEDMSFTLTSWSEGIAPGDFHLPTGYGFDRTAAHTVFDRTLIRAGDTIHMKHLVRTRTDAGFALAAAPGEQTLTITHLGSDTKYEQKVTIGADGVGLSDWTAPKSAALGEYQVTIGGQTYGRFQVDEFRLPTMRAGVSGPKRPVVNPKSVPLDLTLSYFSGGAAGGAPVTLRTRVEPRTIDLPDYPDFGWTAKKIVEGVVPADTDGEGEETPRAAVRASVQPMGLDANGMARVTAPVPTFEGPSALRAEMDYDDANGERLTASTTVPLDTAALRVGVKTDGWLMKSDDARLRLVVLDGNDRPVAGQRVSVALYSRETYSYRKRLIGGFYAYDNSRETKRLSAACDARTDAQGFAVCKLDAGVSGEVIALASTRDAQGNIARATTTLYLAGGDDWWFGGDNGDRMDLLPERPEYAAGGTARFQVRMPFRHATALVTVMRDGVIDSFVTDLSGRDPVIEVALKHGYAPNVYVSVLAVRGRIAGWRLWLAELARRWNLPWISREAAAPTALVDLAKPSYRLGIAKIRVGWDEHRLAVRVQPAADRYRVRQVADVGVTVAPPRGRPMPRGAEVAIAAVDEALLGLKPNDSWDVLSDMMAARPLSVYWSTAQTQVVGKRHYGLKAVAAGGGGGLANAPPRADFQPLLLWRGRVPLDAQGRAAIKVPLNDSLSSFRVVAVATAGADLFGTGAASVRTTQDLILLAGLPPLVRTGDRYDAVVTLRNTTDKAMRATITAHAGAAALPPIALDLAPGAARPVAWRVAAPADEGSVRWQFAASAGGAADRLEITQTVVPAVPVRTLQATLVQLNGAQTIPVALPRDAIPGKGGIEVALSPKLAGSMAGAKAWMRAYPYDCFEQEVSRAVVLGDKALWDRQMAALPRYLDAQGLVKFFPADWLAGDDTLTAYVLTMAAETGWAIPDDPRGKMVAGLKRVVGGGGRSHEDVFVGVKGVGLVGRANLAGDLALRRVGAIAALARAGEAALPMLDTVAADPNAWPTSTVADWLDAVTILQAPPALADAATAVLRARLDSQGTALSLTRPDAMWWLLGSGDGTAARVLLATANRPEWAGDAARVARGLVVRRDRAGAWDTTVSNALATVALARFSARFERVPVTGASTVALGAASRTVAFAAADVPAPVMLPWPPGPAPLTLTHGGAGAPWATVSARSAVPLRQPYASGYAVRRTITPVSQARGGEWHKGDVMRVRIEVDTRADANWTVIDDPVPAGATILGGGLGGRSVILDAGGVATASGPSPAYVERKQEAARAYFDYVPRGRIAYEYSVRLGTPGTFAMPPTHIEALYVPGMIALVPNATLTVLP